jgi:hypothetical protein
VGDDLTIYVNARRADQARTDSPQRAGHLLRLLGGIFVGLGLGSAVLSIVIAVIE